MNDPLDLLAFGVMVFLCAIGVGAVMCLSCYIPSKLGEWFDKFFYWLDTRKKR